VNFFDRYISPSSPHHAKLAIYLVSQVAKLTSDGGPEEKPVVVETGKDQKPAVVGDTPVPPVQISSVSAGSSNVEVVRIQDVWAFKTVLQASEGSCPV
jgi:hypothetical protein